MSCRARKVVFAAFLFAFCVEVSVGQLGSILYLTSTTPVALIRVGRGESAPLPFTIRASREDGSGHPTRTVFYGHMSVGYDSILPSDRVTPPVSIGPFDYRVTGLGSTAVTAFRATAFHDVRFQSVRVNISLDYDPSSPAPYTIVGEPVKFLLHNVNAYSPEFLIVHPATVVPGSKEDVFLYAIGGPDYQKTSAGAMVPSDITVCKDGVALPDGEPIVLGTPYDDTPEEQGRHWILKGGRGKRSIDRRPGLYELNSAFLEAMNIDRPLAFVSPRSKHLGTDGVHTITVYAGPGEDSHLLDEPLTFGVKKTALSGSIRWFKDDRYVRKGTPRLTIRTTDQTGLYTLHRNTRKKKCWYIQIRIQLSPCPRDEQFNRETCEDPVHPRCYNGGVLSHRYSPSCQCPPCFRGFYCEHLAPFQNPFAIRESRDFTCGQLPGGHEECKGFKFCLGGNYGCSCGCGWYGQDCDRPCRKGFYGADCSQKCNCLSSSCDRFTGQCESSLSCPSGFHGFNCQVPDSVNFGSVM